MAGELKLRRPGTDTSAREPLERRRKPPVGRSSFLKLNKSSCPVQFTDEQNLRFAEGEAFKSFAKTDLRKSLGHGTKGLGRGDYGRDGKSPQYLLRADFHSAGVFLVWGRSSLCRL